MLCIYQTLNHMHPSERRMYLSGWHVYLSEWHVYLSEQHIYLSRWHVYLSGHHISVWVPYISVQAPDISVQVHPGTNSFIVLTLYDSFPRVYLRTSVDLRDWLVDSVSQNTLKSLLLSLDS